MSASTHILDRVAAVQRIQGLPDTAVLSRAVVPEHSVFFMEAASGGHSFTVADYLFYTAEDWLIAIGYPLAAKVFESQAFASALTEAVDDARHNIRPASMPTDSLDVYYIGPCLPSVSGQGSVPVNGQDLVFDLMEEDCFYTLAADSAVPLSLARHVRRAAERLTVRIGSEFTPSHRRLWSEMIVRPDMSSRVRELYAKTERIAASGPEGLYFLDALDHAGNLAASLLLDRAPGDFLAYIIGAHSRRTYQPHATDLLFAHMLEQARQAGKAYIHLGLGVNAGITRFKRKWGGRQGPGFVMAQARYRYPDQGTVSQVMEGLAQGLRSLPTDMTKQQLFDTFPKQRPFAMLWQTEKNGVTSWVGGSAHFALYSHEHALERLFHQVDAVLFEGPLDPDSLALFEKSGRTRQPDDPRLIDLLSREEYAALRRMVRGPEGRAARILGLEYEHKTDVDYLLTETRPWYAFFSLWSGYLLSRGWKQSVDLEAWNLAKEIGKAVIPMESHEEQLASLGSVPVERILSFLRSCRTWPRLAHANQKAYLSGNLAALFGTSTEFPTRTGTVINLRDERFCERMQPFLEAGRCAAFVGTAHMVGMRDMLRQRGFTVSKVYPTLAHKLRARLAIRFRAEADYE